MLTPKFGLKPKMNMMPFRANSEILAKIGILPENIAFFQSFRKGTKTGGTVTLRRAADGVTQTFTVGKSGYPEAAIKDFGGSDKLYLVSIIGQANRVYPGKIDNGYNNENWGVGLGGVAEIKSTTIVLNNYNGGASRVDNSAVDDIQAGEIYTVILDIKSNTLDTSLFVPFAASLFESGDNFVTPGTTGYAYFTMQVENPIVNPYLRIQTNATTGSAEIEVIGTFPGVITDISQVDLTEVTEVPLESTQPTAANQPLFYDNGFEAVVENLLGSDGNFEIDTNSDGLADGWSSVNVESLVVVDNIQSFTPRAQYGNIKEFDDGDSYTNGDLIYVCAYVKTTSTGLSLQMASYNGTKGSDVHTGSGNFEFLSVAVIFSTAFSKFFMRFMEMGVTLANVEVKTAIRVNVQDLYAASGMTEANFKIWLDGKVQDHISKYGYITQADIIGLKDSLGRFDGDDWLSADLPDLTEAPITWWARLKRRTTSNYHFVFARNGADHTEMQYAASFGSSSNNINFKSGNNDSYTTLQLEVGDEALIAYVWDGVNINAYKVQNSIVTQTDQAALSGALASYANSFVGARNNGTPNYEFDGEIKEVGIVTQELTEEQILALW